MSNCSLHRICLCQSSQGKGSVDMRVHRVLHRAQCGPVWRRLRGSHVCCHWANWGPDGAGCHGEGSHIWDTTFSAAPWGELISLYWMYCFSFGSERCWCLIYWNDLVLEVNLLVYRVQKTRKKEMKEWMKPYHTCVRTPPPSNGELNVKVNAFVHLWFWLKNNIIHLLSVKMDGDIFQKHPNFLSGEFLWLFCSTIMILCYHK